MNVNHHPHGNPKCRCRYPQARLWQCLLAGTLVLAAQAPAAMAQALLELPTTLQEKAPPPIFEQAPGAAPVAPGPVSAAVGCASCGSGGCCYAGRFRDCCGCNTNTFWGRCL